MENFGIDDLGSKRHKKLLSDLRLASIDPNQKDNDDYESTPIHIPKSIEDESSLAREDRQKREDEATDSWLGVIQGLTEPVFLKKAKKNVKIDEFLPLETKKEKKKRKKDKLKSKEPTDFEKVFATEDAAITNLMREQTKFVQSLQKEWDNATMHKGTSRGVTKTTTEIATNISSARNLMLAMVKQKIDLKKTIADLTLKEKKELGQLAGEDADELGFAGSDFIKQVVKERAAGAKLGDIGDTTVIDMDSIDNGDFFDSLDNDDGLDERSTAASKYLQYEVLEPTEYVVVHDEKDPQGYSFKVLTIYGDDITDEYPLPEHTNMSYNISTGVATNPLGQRFQIYQPDAMVD